jgi:excisionase family DNA binding protein
MTNTDRLMSVEEVADFLGVPVQSVRKWRYLGTGPTGLKVGRHVRYRRADLEKWLDAQAMKAS